MQALNEQQFEQVNGGVAPIVVGAYIGAKKAITWGAAAYAGGYLAQKGANKANEHDGQ